MLTKWLVKSLSVLGSCLEWLFLVWFLQNGVFVLVNVCLSGTELGGATKRRLEQDEHHEGGLEAMCCLSMPGLALQQLSCTAQEMPRMKVACLGEICFCYSNHKQDTVFHGYSFHCI